MAITSLFQVINYILIVFSERENERVEKINLNSFKSLRQTTKLNHC